MCNILIEMQQMIGAKHSMLLNIVTRNYIWIWSIDFLNNTEILLMCSFNIILKCYLICICCPSLTAAIQEQSTVKTLLMVFCFDCFLLVVCHLLNNKYAHRYLNFLNVKQATKLLCHWHASNN